MLEGWWWCMLEGWLREGWCSPGGNIFSPNFGHVGLDILCDLLHKVVQLAQTSLRVVAWERTYKTCHPPNALLLWRRWDPARREWPKADRSRSCYLVGGGGVGGGSASSLVGQHVLLGARNSRGQGGILVRPCATHTRARAMYTRASTQLSEGRTRVRGQDGQDA